MPDQNLDAADMEFIKNLHGGALPQGGLKFGEKPPQNKIEAGYEKIAKPATDFAARTIYNAFHPLAPTDVYTPVEKLPPYAQEVAKFVIPQTGTSAATTAAALLMPEAGAAKILGEGAGPIAKAIGTRLGRTAVGTAAGAAGGQLTGEGAGSGALQGAETFALPELAGRYIGKAAGKLGETSSIERTTRDFGNALERTIPWVGKLEKGSDFANAFIHGQATERARNLLNSVKDTLARRSMGHGFDVPVPTNNGIIKQRMSFVDADNLITQLQRGYGFNMSGAEKAGPNAREARALSYAIRDRVADGLNQIKGGLGDAYLKARKQFDAAMTMGKIFDRDVIGVHGINQPMLIDRLNDHSDDLSRSLGEGTAQRLLGILRRGFIGEGKDIPGKPAHTVTSGPHLFPPFFYKHRTGGQAYQPVGRVGGLVGQAMRANMAPIEADISNHLGKPSKPEVGEGVKALRQAQADNMAPSPSGTKRALKMGDELRKGKTPEVHNDLARGRLSMDEVNKIVGGAGKSDAMAMLEDVPLHEAVSAAEVASPEERKMLVPLIQRKMQQEMQGGKHNRTQMASIARRMQALQNNTVPVAEG